MYVCSYLKIVDFFFNIFSIITIIIFLMYTIIANSGTFHINTDIFETNILNLSVVIGVLVFYGRTAFYEVIYLVKLYKLRGLSCNVPRNKIFSFK